MLVPLLVDQMLGGLRDGLSALCGPTRVALLLARGTSDPLMVHDPEELLRGYEDDLVRLYLDTDKWRPSAGDPGDGAGLLYRELDPPALAETIGFAASSPAAAYHAWIAAPEASLCGPGPVVRWLQHASELFTQEIDLLNRTAQLSSAPPNALRAYAREAIAQHIQHALQGTPIDFARVLASMLEISRTLEEGVRPSGGMIFLPAEEAGAIRYWARLRAETAPRLRAHKHVRKLLTTVEGGERVLVSDGVSILGIADGAPPDRAVQVWFRSGRGEIRIGEERVCTFADGHPSLLPPEPSIDQFARVLRGVDLSLDKPRVLRVVGRIVREVVAGLVGCTIVVDSRATLPALAGERLVDPVDLHEAENWRGACGMAHVDGALHLDGQARLHAFGCLLDGVAVPTEQRSRGARYNSALRYSSANHDVLVVVVSKDGPIAVFHAGRDLAAPRRPAEDASSAEALPLERYVAQV